MFFIRYQIDYCEILCKKIGAKNVHQSPMELMKTIARLHFDIFEYVTSFGVIFNYFVLKILVFLS